MSAAERGDVSSAAAPDIDEDLEFAAARQGLRRGAPGRQRPRSRSTPCATRPPTSWPRPSWTCSRARSWASGRPSRTASTTTSTCRAPLTAGGPRRHRGADARLGRGGPSVRAPGVGPRRGAHLPRGRRARPTRWRSSTTCARPPPLRGEPPPPVSTYQHGPFIDLCRGPHVASTGTLGPFKLLSVAGAYWRGREDRPMLQRIYGTVWSTQEELDLYLWRREEARKRDHRRLGVALDLFSFHDVSPGSAFWHPKGQRLWRTLEGAMRELQERRGYQEISTPILVHKKLWEQSGHWDHYGDNMFRVESEGQTFSLKPMNCPESTYIYKSRVRSYRDLPLRLNEYGRLHRNERSGALSGLTRVRHFIQDDAHIYVRPDQLADEIEALLGEVAETYAWFGLVPRFAFATRPDKALGDPAAWAARRGAHPGGARRRGRELRRSSPGRHVLRAQDRHLHRRRAGSRVADGHHPGGPDDAAGALRPALHRRARPAAAADRHPPRHLRLAGALHRHPRGALRGRLPVLVRARPGGRRAHRGPPQRGRRRAGGGAARARASGSRWTTPRTGCRTRSALAQEQKVPYMLVLGDREVEARTAAPRTRAGEQQEPLAWEALAERLAAEAAARRPD